jgi:myo-inositol 2-dehydrogenase/D-chiro-inositol 1-dehydrogenase
VSTRREIINVGVIGVGRIGKLHTENLAYRIPEAHILAVADIQQDAAKQIAARLNVPAAHADYHEILDNKEIDAILICSATDTHARIIEEAAAARKHIFCEKPIDLDLKRIDQALAAVQKAGVKLQVGFNRRYDSNFRQIHDLVQAGKIGEPHLLRITSRDPAPPPLSYIKVSGGIFLDMTIHDFDMARYLVGSEVTEVFAAGGVLVDPQIGQAGDLDTAVTTLRFANGAIGAVDNSRKAVYGYDQRAEVFGSGGVVANANNTPNSAVTSDASGVHGPLPLYFFLERYNESYVAEMREFIDCIKSDTAPSVGGADARKATVIGLAARQSSQQNRVVKISEIG